MGRPGKPSICSKCGAELESQAAAAAHWREAHPGEVSDKSAKDRARRARARAEREPTPPPTIPLDLDEPAPVETPPNLAGGGDPAPAVDLSTRRRLRDRLWGSKEPKPLLPAPRARSSRRESAEPILRTVWSAAGAVAIRTGFDAPVGRCMQFQAPAMGEALDRFLANGWLDRVALQPLAQRADELEVVAAGFLLPLSIGAYERGGEEVRGMLEPLILELVRMQITAMAPVLAKRRKREKEIANVVEQMREAGELDDETAGADDVALAIVQAIFAGDATAEPPAAEESEAAAV